MNQKPAPVLFATFLAISLVFSCDGPVDDDPALVRDECQQNCSDINFGFETCVEPAVLSDCRDACLNRSPGDAESFTECVRSNAGSSCERADCLSILEVSTEPNADDGATNATTNGATEDPVADCKAHCDEFDECVTERATVAADCKSACETVDEDSLQSYNSCASGASSCFTGPDCYDHLGVAWIRDCSGGAGACTTSETCTDGECL